MERFFPSSPPPSGNEISIHRQEEEIRQTTGPSCHFPLDREDLYVRESTAFQRGPAGREWGEGNQGLRPKSEYQLRKALCF